ncbi:PASTA domain-containing protein [Tenacibaculum amylolyticum]|uniref:PASTA domain-containing protein n=1 Tax=Tenacibaculum amylolyticum TaxID=104269 RepID=UPI003895081A
MSDIKTNSDVRELLSAPLGELISSIGQGVAEAQKALDAASLSQTLALYDEDNPNEVLKQLREIGYQPTFYTIPETEVEAKVSLALSSQKIDYENSKNHNSSRMYATPVNASSSNKYNINGVASATLKFKIVPVPPSNEVEDMRVVPNLVGKQLNQAITILQRLGIAYNITDDISNEDDNNFKIKTQDPDPGTISKRQNVVVLLELDK